MQRRQILLFIVMIIGIILIVVGISTLPTKITRRSIGNQQTETSDDEYTAIIIRSPAFIEILVGTASFIMGIGVHMFHVVRENAVAPAPQVRFADSV